MSKFLFEQIHEDLKHVDNMPFDSPVRANAKRIETTFSLMVDRLRSPLTTPLPAINELMTLFWRLVGNRICPSCMGGFKTVSFWAEKKAESAETIALIICPQNWCQMLEAEPAMQLGALVFNASKAKDYWNGHIPVTMEDRKKSWERAASYESEFLQWWKLSGFSPNEYQKSVMAQDPNGVSDVSHHYAGRPYDGVGPPFPVSIQT